MDPTDDMIMTLQITVDELKKGITEYSNKMNTVAEENKQIYYEYIKEMHQIAMSITEGIKGVERLRHLKGKLANLPQGNTGQNMQPQGQGLPPQQGQSMPPGHPQEMPPGYDNPNQGYH